jgi:hypothetical protein
MGKFLKRHKLQKLTQNAMCNLDIYITIKEIYLKKLNLYFKVFKKKIIPGPGGFGGKFYQMFKKERINSMQTPPENKRGGEPPNSFNEACITLRPKSDIKQQNDTLCKGNQQNTYNLAKPSHTCTCIHSKKGVFCHTCMDTHMWKIMPA